MFFFSLHFNWSFYLILQRLFNKHSFLYSFFMPSSSLSMIIAKRYVLMMTMTVDGLSHRKRQNALSHQKEIIVKIFEKIKNFIIIRKTLTTMIKTSNKRQTELSIFFHLFLLKFIRKLWKSSSAITQLELGPRMKSSGIFKKKSACFFSLNKHFHYHDRFCFSFYFSAFSAERGWLSFAF